MDNQNEQQKTTELSPEPVANADDMDAKLKAWGEQLQGQDLAGTSKSLAVQARAEADFGKWIPNPNELQRLADLESNVIQLARDIALLRTGQLGPGQLVPQHHCRIMALEAACGIKFADGREVQDWTYEDGFTGFTAVKAERDQARARVAELEAAHNKAQHAYRP